MTDEERFYLERDRRTREIGVTNGFELPVRLAVGRDVAGSVRGQATVLALVNMLARVHRRLHLDIPPVELLRPALVHAARLDDAAAALARAINPYIGLDTGSCSIAIGLGVDGHVPWHVGAHGQVAIVDRQPAPFELGETFSLGAGLAACLGAAAVLRQALGYEQRPVRLSAWNYGQGNDAEHGPELLGPLDVGSVLQIGAGGVGSCLNYWLREFGTAGDWCVLDRDHATLHNTNRCLGLLLRHAGWPHGPEYNKADAAAELFRAVAYPSWYDEFDHDAFKPDVVLPLANERGIRDSVACRGEPFLLHATTSRGWEAQLHRHIAGVDDCIVCRMPGSQSQVELACSTVPLEIAGAPSTDAALPFLSAAAGLLLASGLYRLQHGVLAHSAYNLSAVCFRDVRRHSRHAVCPCREGCSNTLPMPIRQKIHAGRRWSHLDAATASR